MRNSILSTAQLVGRRLAPSATHLQPQPDPSIGFARAYASFRPVYALSQSNRGPLVSDDCHQFLASIVAQRFANTSSGIYGPSTLVNRLLNNPSSQSHLSVLDDSDHLPSLPVPNLQNTMELLRESISPIAMNSTEFVNTLNLIEDFSKSAAVKLDLLLREKARKTKNWATHDWWIKEAYLKSRNSLVINSNPAMIYPELPFEVSNNRALINTIAQLTSSIIEFKLALAQGYNPEATSSDNECRLDPNWCYHQYKHLFGTTRIPSKNMDLVEVQRLPTDTSNLEPMTFVISFRGKFFEVQLQDIENELSRADQIAFILDKIITPLGDPVSLEPSVGSTINGGVGVLTTAHRDDWAEAYKLLDNGSMQAIQKAQFIVCIDSVASDGDTFLEPLLTSPVGSESHLAALSRQILHGDSENVGNRWFDKSIQLIVVADEKAEKLLGAGINYEHCLPEGIAIAKMIEYSYDKVVQNNRQASMKNYFAKQQVPAGDQTTFIQLKMFNESHMDRICHHTKHAKQNFVSRVHQFDLSYLIYKQYGSNAIKSWHFSPDSWFQVSLQLAYYNLHKRLGPCYETASTKRFAYGRTDTIRSLTKDVAQFCFEPNYDTMYAAIKSHKTYSNAAINGLAIDRVLMGYKLVFNELKTKSWSWGLPDLSFGAEYQEVQMKPVSEGKTISRDESSQSFDIEQIFSEKEISIISAFFNNELINRSSKFSLSTSQVSSSHPNICMNYGPLLADGYGCCYNITGQQIVAAITANSENQSFSCEVHELNKSINESMDKMRDIVEGRRSKS